MGLFNLPIGNFIESVIAGVAGGMAGDRARKVAESIVDPDARPDPKEAAPIIAAGLLRQIADNTKPADATCMSRLEEYAVLWPYPSLSSISYRGRQKLSCLVQAPFTVVADVPGIGSITKEIGAGWNELDMPEHTRYGVPLGQPAQTVFLRLDDVGYGAKF